MTSVPVVFLGCLELALRWGGYGYDPGFFRQVHIDGQNYFVPNEEFGFRFFPPAMARSVEPFRMAVDKATNSFRLFLLGESAANGDPDSTYGVGRYLEVLLRDRFPGVQFQVVCVAMTASDSNVILPIARECARHDGDLWIIYMGNNEMVGPFGAETSYGLRAPGRIVIQAVLAVKTLRVGQLVDDIIGRLRGGSTTHTWGGMQMFANNRVGYSDPARLRAYANFKGNLEDILGTAHAARVPVILSTVAVNLRECPPFASIHQPPLAPAQESEWSDSYRPGVTSEAEGSWAEAIEHYMKAATIGPHYAELEFRQGRCELAMTNREQALRAFESARDSDALEFRADSRINAMLQEAATRHAAEGVHFLDSSGLLAGSSADGIPGLDLFYEHVHLNLTGNYRLARGFAEETRKLLPASLVARDKGSWSSQDMCDRRLAVTVWDRRRVWDPILSRVNAPPFTGQFDHTAMMERYAAKLAEVRAQMDTQTPEQAKQVYEKAIAQAPDDYFLHGNFERFLEAGGFISQAVVEAKRCCELVPWTPGGYYYAGKLLVQEGKMAEAEAYFTHALAIRPNYAEALNGLAEIRANQQRIPEATGGFTRAIRANPNGVEPYVNLGFLQENQGDLGGALGNYAKAAALQPEGPADYFNRAALAASRYQWDDVIACLRGVVRAQPDFWQAHYKLGIQLAAKGAAEDAERQLEQAVRYRPDFKPARLSLGAAMVAQGKLSQAMGEYRAVLQLDPMDGDARRQIDAIEAQLQHSNAEAETSKSH